jgi:hypothetical protein
MGYLAAHPIFEGLSLSQRAMPVEHCAASDG